MSKFKENYFYDKKKNKFFIYIFFFNYLINLLKCAVWWTIFIPFVVYIFLPTELDF